MTATATDEVRLVYLPATKGAGRVHRTTCEHIPAKGTPIPAERVDPDALYDATRATCCSPRMFDIRNAIAAQTGTTTKENAMPNAAQKSAKNKAADAPKPAAAKDKAEKAPAKPAASKKAAAAPAKDKADAAPARTKVGTFDVGTKDKFKCQGECGETLPVKKFPTVGTEGKRAVECRPDRDKRTKAEKAARAAAKAK
ncbi:hypothetical protein NYO98_10375 [Nocardioides sp. STR2]|uniref:Uncharacterized protein n=1 Tax=Nocardioides pini TaxID=2975053 RepID=A0ABT4CCI8_9ACTN|nr:hypothetical protein [Nocardioides pini]MCY4726683.1 hypothetical protein [Nocardioides pini]